MTGRGQDPLGESAITARAAAAGIELSPDAIRSLTRHASLVLERNDELHLTAIREPGEFLERHLGECFEGAAMLPADASGSLLDLGSGNGYPGLAVVSARPGLRPLLAEASVRKAEFLRQVLGAAFPDGEVLQRQVQRPVDLVGVEPLRAIVTRAAGSWERILPRLAACLRPEGSLLVWAGPQMEPVMERKAWHRYRYLERRALPGREHSWVWQFSPRALPSTP